VKQDIRKHAKPGFSHFMLYPSCVVSEQVLSETLEPFDRDVHRKHLLGPTCECIEFVDSLASKVDNLKIQLDMAHVAFFGDTHPPIGYPDGEIDVPQVTGILRCLLDVGYLSRQQRGVPVIETQPAPGMTVEQTIEQQTALLDRAWREV